MSTVALAANGSIFAIMGASGSGKSSLLKVLIGLQRPSAGEIVFWASATARWATPSARRSRGKIADVRSCHKP
jgi:phospholipid/cholesterol/gamma-HCH transport system ATP-binding protein